MSINAQPFQPQFKLIGNLAEDQVLVYDTSEGAFVNSAGSGGGGASGFTAIENVGTTGTAIHYGEAGTTLQLKKLIGGDNLTITDNGTGGLILAATNTDTIQDGTNLGSGTGLFSSKDSTSHALQFKSLAVGAGLTLTDDGNGTITLVNTIASGTTDADLTLSNLSNVETARTNLDVYSKAEGDTRYHDKFSNFLPSQNNVYDVGSPSFKFNDIYAETFQGTAILAENLAISGTAGQVLTHNGSTWVAGAGSSVLSSASDMSNVAPADGQHLVWDAGTSLWTPSSAGEGMGGGGYGDSNARGAISVSGDLSYNNSTGVISFTQNDAWSNITGTPTTLAGYGITDAATSAQGALADSALQSVPAQTFASLTGKPTTLAGYGITDGGGSYDNSSVDTHLNTGTATANQALVWTGTDYDWVTSTDSDTTYTAGTGLTLTGTEFSLTSGHFDGAFTSLSGVASAGASEDDMVLYYDHSTTSFKWKAGGTPAGYNNTNWDTAFGWGDHSQQGYLTTITGHYTDSDVDTHLNVSGATNDQMLKWTGTDYAWVTSTDSDTTYTAGTNVTINGSNVISATDTNTTYVSSDFTHDDLTGYVPLEHIDWTTDQGPSTNIHAGNYIDTNTTYSNLSEFTNDSGYITSTGVLSSHTDVHTSAPSNGDVLKWDAGNSRWAAQADSVGSVTATSTTAFTNKSGAISQWTNDAGYLTSETAHYSNSDVDTHLNTGGAGANQVLSWTGTDYDWITTGAHFDGNYSSLVGAPTTVSSFTNDAGYLTAQTDSQTLSLSGTTLAITGGNNVDLGALTIDDMADVNITSVADNQFLKYDNASGDWLNETVTIPADITDLTDTTNLLTHTTYNIIDNGIAGNYNLGVGDSALDNINSNGATQHNTGVGYNALSNLVSGWSNTAVGSNASGGNVSGYQNVAVGTSALSSGTGSNNTAIGTFAGQLNTGHDNVFIGFNAGQNQTNATNKLFIANRNGSTLIGGDFQQGTVTFNDAYTFPAADGTASQVLTTDGAGNLSWTSVAGSYTDADARLAISATTGLSYNNTTGVMALNASVDDLLDVNSAGATLNQVLKWNGTAWSPALDVDTTYTAGANVAISGTNVISATDTNTTYVDSDWNHDALTNFVANEHIDWTQSGAGTIHASNYTDTNTDTTYTAGANVAISGTNVISATDTNTTYTNVSEFTNDSGYLVSGDLSGYAQTSSLATVATTGNYSDLSGTPTMYANSDVDSHLNQSNPTSGYVLSWNGSDYAWVAQSGGGGGATDKIEEGNSSVEVIDGGANGHVMFNTNGTDRWQVTNSGHILPEATETYDIGSADKKVRHLFLSDNSLYIDTNTIKTSGTNLLFNDEDVMDYANLKNKPDTSSGGTGIQVNSGVVSLNSALSGLSDVSSTTPNSGEVLKWNGSEWAPGTDLTSGSSAMNDLSDVDTSGISSGQYLKWNGSAFVASTVTAGATSIDALTDVDTTTSAPSNGDVLTWVQADSEWAPQAPSGGGGGGSGASVEYFKLNYASNGNLTSITNATSGVSATILSATGGDVEISFSGASYPPSSILIYGYAYSANQYVIMPLSTDITTRVVDAGGTAGSPTAFGSFSSTDMTLKLRENDTGASRGFGTTTHAWIMFTLA